MSDLIVRGGTVVDGTGAAGRVADVRVRDGVIVEVGRDLAPDGEREIDARDAVVTPGLIDSHTHYDIEMFWDPSLDPLPLYGMTTAVMGNCGLGIAPIRPTTRDAVSAPQDVSHGGTTVLLDCPLATAVLEDPR